MENKKLYLILIDNSGGEYHPMIYSIWDSRTKAENEIKRLNNSDLRIGWSVGDAGICEVEMNKEYNNEHELDFK